MLILHLSNFPNCRIRPSDCTKKDIYELIGQPSETRGPRRFYRLILK